MSVSNINGFSDFTTMTRNILLRYEGQPMASLKEIKQAALQTSTHLEKMQQTGGPLDRAKEMKNYWVI